jgi:hypothetical protein
VCLNESTCCYGRLCVCACVRVILPVCLCDVRGSRRESSTEEISVCLMLHPSSNQAKQSA